MTIRSPDRYVIFRKFQKESMLSSFGVNAEKEDWFCSECFDEPPPTFFVPPPPCPPSVDIPPSFLGVDDDPPASCTAFMGAREEVSQGEQIPLTVVAITAVISVILVTMISCVVYRIRIHKKRPSKSPPREGAIIYDDLTPSIQPLTGRHPPHILWAPMGARYPPRYTQTPSISRSEAARSKGPLVRHGEAYEISLSSSEDAPAPLSEPLYHTISSASGSGSEQCSSELQVLYSSASPRRCPLSDSEEDDSTTPFIGADAPKGDSDSLQSPSQARYYLSVPLDSASLRPSSISTLASSNEYETLPLRGGRPPTPQERGLPPLPSRSERFRMFLPSDKTKTPLNYNRRGPGPPSLGRGIHRASYNRHHEVLYENIVPSSNL